MLPDVFIWLYATAVAITNSPAAQPPQRLLAFITLFPFKRDDAAFEVTCSTGDRTGSTRHLSWRCRCDNRRIRFMIIEIVIPPSVTFGISLSIFDSHIGAIPRAGKISPPRWFRSRTIRVLTRDRQLQFFYEDCPFWKRVRLFVGFIGARLNVDVVIFWETRHTAVERVGRERGSDINPFVEALG